MELAKVTLQVSRWSHDGKTIITAVSQEVTLLMEQNPFVSKILFLLDNQDIAKKPVLNKRGKLSCPNCLGTALFIAGVDDVGYPYHAYSEELDSHMNPGIKRPGAFIFSYSAENDDWHVGIYLGRIKGEDIAFAQHGHGGRFAPEIISMNYTSPRYHIPATLG